MNNYSNIHLSMFRSKEIVYYNEYIIYVAAITHKNAHKINRQTEDFNNTLNIFKHKFCHSVNFIYLFLFFFFFFFFFFLRSTQGGEIIIYGLTETALQV